MTDGPFYSQGAGKAYTRNGGIVIQNDEGRDVAFIGLMSDGLRRGVEILDEQGRPLVALGDLSDGSQGLEIESATDNWPLIKMTDLGWSAPHIAGVPSDPSAVKSVTSGSFTDTWRVTFGSVLGLGLEVQIPWVTGAGTTGELCVTSNVPTVTQSLALPAASNGYAYVRWNPGLRPGTGPLLLTVQARRTAGANNVDVYPCQGWVQDPALCGDYGIWV